MKEEEMTKSKPVATGISILLLLAMLFSVCVFAGPAKVYAAEGYSYEGYDFLNDAAKSNITEETADVVTDMENVQGLFITYFNANQLDKINDLLADDCNLKIEYDDTIYTAKDAAEAATVLKNIQEMREASTWFDLHLNHSPNFVVNKEANGGRTSYDTYSYFIQKAAPFTCETCFTHMDTEFKTVDGQMKIAAMTWQYMESFKPASYEASKTAMDFSYDEVATQNAAVKTNAKDFTDIQRMMSYFYESDLRDVDEYFVDSEDTVLDLANLFDTPSKGKEAIDATLDQLAAMEEANEGKYISLYYMMDPVINVNEAGDKAEGWFWSQTFEFKGKAFENTNEKIPLVRNVCQIHCDYSKVDGEWMINSFVVTPLVSLPEIAYKSVAGPLGGDRLSSGLENWFEPLDEKGANNGAYAADELVIENMMTGWVSALKRADIMTFYEQCMKPNPDFYMSFNTTGFNAPDLTTDDKIIPKLQSFDNGVKGAEKLPSFHTVTTPCVEFSEDGLSAKAVWAEHTYTNVSLVLQQYPSWAVEEIPEGESAYFNACGKYFWELEKKDGTWLVKHWYFEPVVALTQLNTSPEISRGFTKGDRYDFYPKPFTTLDTKLLNLGSAKTDKAAYTYTGKDVKPVVTVYDADGNVVAPENYTVSYSKNKAVGTAEVVIKAAEGNQNFAGQLSTSFTINKAANKITKYSPASKTFKVKKLKKKGLSFTVKATAKEKAKTTFKLASVTKKAKKYIKVSSKGKVTIKKGLPKGKYNLKIKITTAATANYKKTVITKTIKITVK